MEKVLEAGAELAGGHSIDDKEPKYGLAVTGVARPDEIVYNGGAEVGDKLVLTKRLGIGVLASALKNGIISEADMMPAIEEAAVLNAAAAAAMALVGVHACTDVSGFGLAGHLGEMLDASGAAGAVHLAALPLHDGVLDLIARSVYAGGLRNNRDYLLPRLHEVGPAGAADIGRRPGRRPVRRPRRRAGSGRPRAVRPADLRRAAAGRRAPEARGCCSTPSSTPAPAPGRSARSSPGRPARSCSKARARPCPTIHQKHHPWGEDGRVDPDSLAPDDEERAARPRRLPPRTSSSARSRWSRSCSWPRSGSSASSAGSCSSCCGIGARRSHLGRDAGACPSASCSGNCCSPSLIGLAPAPRHARRLVGDRARLP